MISTVRDVTHRLMLLLLLMLLIDPDRHANHRSLLTVTKYCKLTVTKYLKRR
jgi:hypothetical protein